MATGTATPDTADAKPPRDYIEEQFERLEFQSAEASRFKHLSEAAARVESGLLRVERDVGQHGRALKDIRELLAQVKSQAQRIALLLAVAVLILIALLWLRPSPASTPEQSEIVPPAEVPPEVPDNSPPPPIQPPPVARAPGLLVRRMTSDIFITGRSRCDADNPPCNAWHQGDTAATPGETFETAVDHLLDGIAPGEVLFVVEGGHDSMRVEDEIHLGDNLAIATRRAYRARTALGTLMEKRPQYSATFITTVRGESPGDKPRDEDRSVRISIFGTAVPQGVAK